jgi:hypothetical protein
VRILSGESHRGRISGKLVTGELLLVTIYMDGPAANLAGNVIKYGDGGVKFPEPFRCALNEPVLFASALLGGATPAR